MPFAPLQNPSMLLRALAPTVLGVRTWRTFIRGAPLSKPAVDIATAQPITDADAPVIGDQKSRSFEILNHSAPVHIRSDTLPACEMSAPNSGPLFRRVGWRLGGIRPWHRLGRGVKVARCRPPSGLRSGCTPWVVPRASHRCEDIHKWRMRYPDSCLEICPRGWSHLLLACGDSPGIHFLLCHSDFGSVLVLGSHGGAKLLIQKLDDLD
ncbi:hypothetical protein Tco_1123524 [Tanacetum coccineum]|uniref:Uncharacterized protein n=1 Tax=Tanacetum coccineum TaxID=301880 RepID=A0ABQ5J7D2_9ASTR